MKVKKAVSGGGHPGTGVRGVCRPAGLRRVVSIPAHTFSSIIRPHHCLARGLVRGRRLAGLRFRLEPPTDRVGCRQTPMSHVGLNARTRDL